MYFRRDLVVLSAPTRFQRRSQFIREFFFSHHCFQFICYFNVVYHLYFIITRFFFLFGGFFFSCTTVCTLNVIMNLELLAGGQALVVFLQQ